MVQVDTWLGNGIRRESWGQQQRRLIGDASLRGTQNVLLYTDSYQHVMLNKTHDLCIAPDNVCDSDMSRKRRRRVTVSAHVIKHTVTQRFHTPASASITQQSPRVRAVVTGAATSELCTAFVSLALPQHHAQEEQSYRSAAIPCSASQGASMNVMQTHGLT